MLNYYKWEALISFLGEKERKNTSEGKKKRKKIRAFPRPSLELSPFLLSQLSNTVYQRILTHRSAKRVCVWTLCIVVLRSQGSGYSVILRGLNKRQKKEI